MFSKINTLGATAWSHYSPAQRSLLVDDIYTYTFYFKVRIFFSKSVCACLFFSFFEFHSVLSVKMKGHVHRKYELYNNIMPHYNRI